MVPLTTILSESGWEIIGGHGVVVELNKAVFVQNHSWWWNGCELSLEVLTWPLTMWVLFGQHAVSQLKKNFFFWNLCQYLKAKKFHIKSQNFYFSWKKSKDQVHRALILYIATISESLHFIQSTRTSGWQSLPHTPCRPPARCQLPCNLALLAFSLTIRVKQSHGSKVKIIHKAIQWKAHSYLIPALPKYVLLLISSVFLFFLT